MSSFFLVAIASVVSHELARRFNLSLVVCVFHFCIHLAEPATSIAPSKECSTQKLSLMAFRAH